MLTQTPQAHYVVMRPCRMETSYLGLLVCMENALGGLDVVSLEAAEAAF